MILFDKLIKIKDEMNITIGTFDAIHKGHLKIINKLLTFKEKSLVLSFFPPPFIYFKKESKVLFTQEEKAEILSNLNIDYLLIIPFNEEIKNLKPIDFINLLFKYLKIKRVVLGKNFKFGKNREGDVIFLEKIAKEKRFELIVIEEEKYDGEKISSSKIRKLIKNGEIDKANRFLTHPYFIKFKNDSLFVNNFKLLPPDGKYLVEIEGKENEIEVLNKKILISNAKENIKKITFIKKI